MVAIKISFFRVPLMPKPHRVLGLQVYKVARGSALFLKLLLYKSYSQMGIVNKQWKKRDDMCSHCMSYINDISHLEPSPSL